MSDRLLPFIPLLALLCWAAVGDVRNRLIRNWLTFALVLSGVTQSFAPFGAVRTVSPADSLLGLLTGLGLPLILFVIGAIGGGDVKLLAGIGAWVGVSGVLHIFAAEAVIGMGIVLAQAVAGGRLGVLLRNSAVVAINMFYINDLGVQHVEESGRACRSVERPLPFAVPVLAATMLQLYFTLR